MRGSGIVWEDWHDLIVQWTLDRRTDEQIAEKIRAETGVKIHKQSVRNYRKKAKIKSQRLPGETVARGFGKPATKLPELPVRYENGIPIIECPPRHADTLSWGKWVR